MIDKPILGPDEVSDEDELDYWWNLLTSEIRMHREKEGNESKAKIYSAAMGGDSSFMQALAWEVGERVLRKEHLDPFERFFVVQVMTTLMLNAEAAKQVSGAAGKAGRPKNGARGLMAALLVIQAIREGGAKTIEEAIAQAAEIPYASGAGGMEAALGEDMIKKYWSAWKDDALTLASMTEADLKAAQEANRKGKKPS